MKRRSTSGALEGNGRDGLGLLWRERCRGGSERCGWMVAADCTLAGGLRAQEKKCGGLGHGPGLIQPERCVPCVFGFSRWGRDRTECLSSFSLFSTRAVHGASALDTTLSGRRSSFSDYQTGVGRSRKLIG